MQTDGYPDIERAFSILDAVGDLGGNAPALLGDLQLNGLLREPFPIPIEEAAAELEIVKQHLRRALWLPEGMGFDLMSVVMTPYQPPDRVMYLVPLVSASLGGTIATLNYDNTVEAAGGVLVVTAPPDIKRVIAPQESADKVRLLKLHGSLNWRRVEDDVLRTGRPLETEHYEPAIIFGAANKLRHYGPYLDLLRAFVDRLRESHHLFVLGYGFRDPHINEVLRIWARSPAEDGGRKSLTVCQGPGVAHLPRLVEAWSVYEHLRVALVPMGAGTFIQTLFAPP